MTANQRRPGFRLPWSSETDGPEGESSAPAVEASAEPAPAASTESSTGTAEAKAPAATSTETSPPAEPAAPAEAESPAEAKADAEAKAAPESETAGGEAAAVEPSPAKAPKVETADTANGGDDFMRDLVAAMRKVADEARQAGVTDLRTNAEEQVASLETDAERRREELRARAEADVAGIGDWAKAEAERIRAEAEARVVARRAQLDQQLAGDAARTEAETKALRDRVAGYERELEAFHAQLAEINDPAAFAAAAKRMPQPPKLGAAMATAPSTATIPADGAPVEPATGASNGVHAATADVHPAEEEVLASRLAELDATLPESGATAVAAPAESVTTEVVVKGLGSFGAITGFRQALSGVDGVEGVALSLGQTGEFVFRATHASDFDVRGAITTLEGDGAKVEERPEGGLRVTLDRAR
jgi:hypothetical protein